MRCVLKLFSLVTLGVLVYVGGQGVAFADTATVETLIMFRHGEKPANVDNGQLTCQGQNRALALPSLLIARYGTPLYAFAESPDKHTDDNGNDYWSLRPLATLEPTAVAAGITVDINYSKSDISDVESELAKSKFASALVFLAWEHSEMDQLAVNIVKDNGGDSSTVPAWPDDDYDSIFVITITRSGANTSVQFSHDQEGLDNGSTSCTSVRHFYPGPLPGGR